MEIQDRFGDPATLESPYGFFDELRENSPVYFSSLLNMYVVSRFADVQKILNNPAVFSSEASLSDEQVGNYNLLERYAPLYTSAGVPVQKATLVITDGAVHRRYRSVVDRTFTISSVRKLEPEINETVDRLIDGFIDQGQVDIYKEFCLNLPQILICKLLGLPLDETSIEIMRRSADAVVRLQGGAIETEETRLALHQDQIAFHRFVLDHINAVRAKPDDSLIDQLIQAVPDDGIPLDDAEMISLISALNIGGNETTTNGLGNMFWTCFRDPALQQALREDAELIGKFVEETLRLETPVAGMPRRVTENAMIGEVAVPKDSMVLVSFLSANRDARQYGCPAQVDLARKGIRNHSAFGGGVHFCLGANLARVELNIAMKRVLDRMADIKIPEAAKPLQHHPKFIVRALKSLPVTFTKIA